MPNTTTFQPGISMPNGQASGPLPEIIPGRVKEKPPPVVGDAGGGGKQPAPERKLIHPKFNEFCKWINGYVEGEDESAESYQKKHKFFCVRDITKSIWAIYPILQLFGSFSDRWEKIARGFYGACWSIVYSAYRPFAANRKELGGDKAGSFIKNFYKANEHFRVWYGSFVSVGYALGGFGMFVAALIGNDGLFEKLAKLYKVFMYNQNGEFSSMDTELVAKREYDLEDLPPVHRPKDSLKARIEFINFILFAPNIITRGLETLKLFGLNFMGEGLQRFSGFLEKLSYGTWAARFGIMKTELEEEGGIKRGGDLKNLHPVLFNVQKGSGKVFHYVLPALSFIAAGAELFGFKDIAEKVMVWEGKAERLIPAISAWGLTTCLEGLGILKHSREQPADKPEFRMAT